VKSANTILVLCYGNICRSPFAARILSKALARERSIEVRQGGFYGPGRPSPNLAIAAAGAHGIDLRGHLSRLATRGDAAEAGIIVVMDQSQATAARAQLGASGSKIVFLGDFDPEPWATRTITDPYGLPAAVLTATYVRIERCAGALVRVLRDGKQDLR
jgi:protein-tyrosine phosphatase